MRLYDVDYRGANIYACQTCRVRFVNPQPSDEELGLLYSEYDGTRAPQEDDEEPKESRGKRRRRRKREKTSGELCHDYNFQLIERYVSPGRVLSVGCGVGVDLSVARDRGWEAEGIEIDATRAAQTSERTGCVVWHADLLEFEPEGPPYQCVYMNHVLEHPREPGAWLRKVHELLSPSGVVWIACPNIDSFSNRAKTLMGRMSLKGRRGKHYASWHHLFFFAPGVLTPLLQKKYGFDVVHVQGELRPTSHEEGRAREQLCRAFPNLKSNFQLIARKP